MVLRPRFHWGKARYHHHHIPRTYGYNLLVAYRCQQRKWPAATQLDDLTPPALAINPSWTSPETSWFALLTSYPRFQTIHYEA